MEAFLHNELLWVALTLGIYLVSGWLQRKTGILLLNPILITITLLIVILMLLGIDYSTYSKGGGYIDFFLKPAIVALGVPLYKQLEQIRKQALIIFGSQLIGCIAGVVSVVLIADAMGASRELIYSLAPKSVTTPIAIEVSRSIGGIASLTASVVIVVGLFGAVFGYALLRLAGIKSNMAQSLAIGNTAHAIGTAKSMEISPRYGAMSGIGLILNGILTATLTPYILLIMEKWID